MIPIARPCVGQEEADAAVRVITSGMLASGSEVTHFEREFADFTGTSHAVATSNGTAALHMALTALGIAHGDEVIVPSFTFIASATSVSMCGASPVMADIEEKTYCIDPESVLECITPNTKAVIGVHLFGQPCDVQALSDICADHSLFFIEDCAQAHGAQCLGKTTGSFGTCGCFSFYPTKNMTCGEGGMVTSDDLELVERIRRLINHGQKEKYLHTELGYNFRLTDIAAAIGRIQLRKLPKMNALRQRNAEYFSKKIHRQGIIVPQVRSGTTHVYHQYAIRVSEDADFTRDELIKYLEQKDIGTAIHYPVPIHKQPVYASTIHARECPVSEKISREILSIPVHPGLTHAQRDSITQAVNGYE